MKLLNHRFSKTALSFAAVVLAAAQMTTAQTTRPTTRPTTPSPMANQMMNGMTAKPDAQM